MKLAFSSLACPQWSIEEVVAAAVRYGYAAIEWRLADGQIIEPTVPVHVRTRLREAPAALGIGVACLDTSCRVVEGSSRARAATLDAGRSMVDLAAEIAAPCLRVFGGALPAGATHTQILSPTVEVLHTLGMYAATCGVTLALETHDAWTRSEDILALIQAVNLPSVRVLWDAHHTYRAGETPAFTLERLGNLLACVHLKDSRVIAGEPDAWDYCLLGEGSVPLQEICTLLKSGGYDGPLSLEWEKHWHPAIAGPEVALPQARPYLRNCWQQA